MRQAIAKLLIFSLFFIPALSHAEAAALPKSWTLLIYHNGDDGYASEEDPDDFGGVYYDIEGIIKGLEKTGSTDQVNVLVQRAFIHEKYSVRMQIQKSNNPDVVISPVLQNLGFVDVGNYQTLQNFIDWGVQNFPAQHYMIIITAHGLGWYSQPKGRAKRSIGPDSYFNSEITSPQLGLIMRHAAEITGHKVDIAYFDSCYMQDIETATEIADSVHMIIGSEDEVHSDEGLGVLGQTLAQLALHPDMSAVQLSNAVLDDVAASFQKPPRSDEVLTMSVLDAEKLPALNTAMAKLAKNIRSIKQPEDLQKILSARKKVLSYNRIHFDLMDFIRELQAANIPSLDKNILTEVETALAHVVLNQKINVYAYDDENRKLRYQHAGGLTIWLADEKYDASTMKQYHELKFDQDTKWGAANAAWSQSLVK